MASPLAPSAPPVAMAPPMGSAPMMASPGAYGAPVPPQMPVKVPPAPVEEKGLDLDKLRKWFQAYQDSKIEEMNEQRDARRYYHGAQWTDDERKTLAERGQPPITNNRISLKIDGIVGVVDRLRQDPKASPRSQAFAAGADIGTACVREVLDANQWEELRQQVSQDLAIDGIGGSERDMETDDDGQPNVVLRRVSPETFFYDPRSMKPDFSDARFLGVYKWLDLDAAIELAPDHEEDLRNATDKSGGGGDMLGLQDWEKNWYDARLDRVKLVEIWYKHKGEWWFALHTGDMILKEGQSPWKDRKGKTRHRYRMASAGIDQDGDRYGFYRNMKSPQDEINHRRSKLLWMLNVNQFFYEEGSIDDVNDFKQKLAKPDSAIGFRPSMSGNKPWEIRDQSPQMQGQAELLAEAKAEIDNFGPNPSLLGAGPASASGRAQQLQQQAGIAQLGPYFSRFKAWKLGVYRDIWADIQQFWTVERSIRVAGSEDIQFLDVNKMVMTPEGPRIANAIGDLDLDIVMDEGPDTVTLNEDTMQVLDSMIQKGLLGGPAALPVVAEVMNLTPSIKQKLLQANAPPQADPQAQQMQATAAHLQLQGAAAKIAETEARTEKLHADAAHAQGQAANAGSLADEHAAHTAGAIMDIAHTHAKMRETHAKTAHAALGALGVPPMTAQAQF